MPSAFCTFEFYLPNSALASTANREAGKRGSMSWLKKLVTPITIHEAAKRKDAKALRQAIRQAPSLDDWDEDGKTALLIAVMEQDISCVKELLENGADPNIPTRPEYMPDMMSYTVRRTPLWFALRRNNTEMLQLLILKGANIDDLGEGDPALAEAIRGGNERAVEILIEHGANVNAVANGRTMLQLAEEEKDNRTQTIQWINHDVLALPNYDCEAAVKFIERLQHIAEALKKAGAR